MNGLTMLDMIGMCIPFDLNGSPVCAKLPGSPTMFALMFDTISRCAEEMEFLKIAKWVPKRVDSPKELLDDLNTLGLRVMLNPYRAEGKTRWTEVYWLPGIEWLYRPTVYSIGDGVSWDVDAEMWEPTWGPNHDWRRRYQETPTPLV